MRGSQAVAAAPVPTSVLTDPERSSLRGTLSKVVDDARVLRLARMVMMSRRVRSRFGIERRRDRSNHEAHAEQHLGEHAIGGETQPPPPPFPLAKAGGCIAKRPPPARP